MALVDQLLDRALEYHRAVSRAEALYREVLRLDPQQVDAWHLLGLLAHQAGQSAVALDHIQRAIELAPSIAMLHFNLGQVYRQAGRLQDAAVSYRRAWDLDPTLGEACNNLGIVLRAQGQLDAAIAWYRQALALKPDHAAAHNNLGNLLRDQGQFDEAEACFRRALQTHPDDAAGGRVAVAGPSRGQPLVPHDADLPPAALRGLGRCLSPHRPSAAEPRGELDIELK